MISNFFAIVIAFLGILIAYRQWQTAHYRYKLDMFEKRFEIYNAFVELLYNIRGSGKLEDEHLYIFKGKILSARFIYSDKMANYLNKVQSEAIDMQTYRAELEGSHPAGEERGALIQKEREKKEWLLEQVKEATLADVFGPYLKIEHNSLLDFIKKHDLLKRLLKNKK